VLNQNSYLYLNYAISIIVLSKK